MRDEYVESEEEEEEEEEEIINLPDPSYVPDPSTFPICARCLKPINGRCVTAMFRKFHPECFVCSYCLERLNMGTFKVEGEKPYCKQCFYRLFA